MTSTFSRYVPILEGIKRDNAGVISTMVTAFRLHQAAQTAARTSMARTGELDLAKLHQYKLVDDIFMKSQIVRKGQNHGIVIHVDWSSSMVSVTSSVLWQTLNLIWFAEKINVPVEVYLFTNGSTPVAGTTYNNHGPAVGRPAVGRDVQIYDSAASKADRTDAQIFILGVIMRYANVERYDYNTRSYKPYFDMLPTGLNLAKYTSLVSATEMLVLASVAGLMSQNSTPLAHAIFTSVETIRAFRERHRLENCVSVWLTDGDDNCKIAFDANTARTDYHDFYAPLTGKEYKTAAGEPVINSYLRYHRDATGAKVIIIDIGVNLLRSAKRYISTKNLNSLGITIAEARRSFYRSGAKRFNAPAKANIKSAEGIEAAFYEDGVATITNTQCPDLAADVLVVTAPAFWSKSALDKDLIKGQSPATVDVLNSIQETACLRNFMGLLAPFLAKARKA